jgi:hypothetical protein
MTVRNAAFLAAAALLVVAGTTTPTAAHRALQAHRRFGTIV